MIWFSVKNIPKIKRTETRYFLEWMFWQFWSLWTLKMYQRNFKREGGGACPNLNNFQRTTSTIFQDFTSIKLKQNIWAKKSYNLSTRRNYNIFFCLKPMGKSTCLCKPTSNTSTQKLKPSKLFLFSFETFLFLSTSTSCLEGPIYNWIDGMDWTKQGRPGVWVCFVHTFHSGLIFHDMFPHFKTPLSSLTCRSMNWW